MAGMGMKVLVWGQERSLQKALRGSAIEVASSKDDLFERSDVLSLHVRLAS